MTAAEIMETWPEWKRNYRLTKYCVAKMTDENSIRRLVMAGKSELVRALLLTDSQVELVRAVELAGSMSTETLAVKLNITSQNASAKLNRLYRAGYLHRKIVSAKSGGIEYIYTVDEQ